MPDDLEHTLRDSLDRHARSTVRPSGQLDDVFARVDRRRSRRRVVAIVGSFAVVAAGVLGIAAISRSGGSAELGAADEGDEAATTTIDGAWACSGALGNDGSASYFSDCYQVPWEQASAATCDTAPPTTAVATTATVPVATSPPEFEPDPCGAPINGTAEACAQVVAPTTTPPITIPATTAPVTVVEAITATTYDVVDCPPPTLVTDTTSDMGTVPFTSAPQVPSSTYAPNALERSYPVVAGDSIYAIAGRFGFDPQVIVDYNGWTEGLQHVLLVGDIVKIPPNLSG